MERRKMAALLALIAAGLVSAATSKVLQAAWLYSETSDAQSLTLDDSTPRVTFDVTITASDAMREAEIGDMTLLAHLAGSGGPASLLVLVTDPTGAQNARTVALEDSVEQDVELGSHWLAPGHDDTLAGTVQVSFEVGAGEAASGTFEITASVSGPFTSEEPVDPPAGSDLTIEIVQR